MIVNTKKCVVIHAGNNNPNISYTLAGGIVADSNKIKDLGLTVDSQLKFTFNCSIV